MKLAAIIILAVSAAYSYAGFNNTAPENFTLTCSDCSLFAVLWIDGRKLYSKCAGTATT